MIPKGPIATEVLNKPEATGIWAIGGLQPLVEKQEDEGWWREARESGVCVRVSRNHEGLDPVPLPISGLLKPEVQDLLSGLARVLRYKSCGLSQQTVWR